MRNSQKAKETKRLQQKVTHYASIVIGAGLIFMFGWGIGSNRINVSFSSLQSQNQSLPQDLDYSSVEQVYDALRQNYDGELSQEELLTGLKQGLTGATNDPHTEYLTPDEARDFNNDLNGTFSGIGAELSKKDDTIVIVAPLAGSPAEKAGLQAQDTIVEIDGTSTYKMTVADAVKRIRGAEGTEVKLTVLSNGKEKELTITRQKITTPSVTHEVKDGLGYVEITRFSDETSRLAKQAAEEFKQKNVQGVVVDVRGNPGGLLESSVDVASLWLDPGQTVLSEKRDGQVIETYKASGENPLQGIPTVVLIDEGSASASEILAGALKDNNAATLVGMQTFGKGSVQNLKSLPEGGVIKITIARWFTPAGRNIDKEGIAPDKKIEVSEADIQAKRDTQRQAARELLLAN